MSFKARNTFTKLAWTLTELKNLRKSSDVPILRTADDVVKFLRQHNMGVQNFEEDAGHYGAIYRKDKPAVKYIFIPRNWKNMSPVKVYTHELGHSIGKFVNNDKDFNFIQNIKEEVRANKNAVNLIKKYSSTPEEDTKQFLQLANKVFIMSKRNNISQELHNRLKYDPEFIKQTAKNILRKHLGHENLSVIEKVTIENPVLGRKIQRELNEQLPGYFEAQSKLIKENKSFLKKDLNSLMYGEPYPVKPSIPESNIPSKPLSTSTPTPTPEPEHKTTSRPKWPYIVIPTAVLGTGAGIYYLNKNATRNPR